MCGCCSTAVSSVTVLVSIVTLLSLVFDSANNQLNCNFNTNVDDVSVSWTKNGVYIGETDPFFDQTPPRRRQSSTSDTYMYTATLTARNRRSFEGTFECIASYDGKTMRKTITLSAPPSPRNLHVINTTATSITIAWEPPLIDDSNGNSIVAYRVTYGSISRNIPATERSYVANSLYPNTFYRFSVFATTVVEGRPASIKTKTQEAAPSTPLNIRAFNTSSTSLRIEWNPPANPNGIIRGYLITYYKTASVGNNNSPAVMTQDVVGNVISFELMDLEIYTTYSISIQGRTILLGEASTIVNATTEEDAPSPPTVVRAFNTSSTSLRVQWNPPSTPNGIIRGYLITYYKTATVGNPLAVMTQDVPGNETSYELTGLEIYTTYSISIQGRTILLGEASTTVNATTEEDAPSPPTVVRAFNTSSTSLRVEWNRPKAPNGIIRGYLITYYPTTFNDSTLTVMTQVVAGNEPSYELTGLEIYTTYSISIQGRTILLGEASTTVNATTDEDVPTPPINITVADLNTTSIQISWTQPSSPNGVLLRYTLYYRPQRSTIQDEGWQTVIVLIDAIGLSFNSYTYIFTGLMEYTLYEVVVTASTRIGESVESHPVIVTTDPESSDPPTAVSAVPIDSSTIRISWGFPNVPRGKIRGYMVTYGAVNQASNFSYAVHNITLSRPNDMRNQTAAFGALQMFTCYWFEIAAYAFSEPGDTFQIHHGLRSQPVMGCTFDEDIWFQLRIADLGKKNCDDWVEDDVSRKLSDVEASIVSNVETLCMCGFTKNFLKNGVFRCFPNSKNAVTYRGVLNGFGNTSSEELIAKIEQWIRRNVTIPLQKVLRPVDGTCTVRIPSRDAEECESESNATPAVIHGRLLILVVVLLSCTCTFVTGSIIGSLAVLYHYCWRTRRHSQTSPNDQHSNDNSLSLPAKVNDSDSEKKQHFGTGKVDMKFEDVEVDEINKYIREQT